MTLLEGINRVRELLGKPRFAATSNDESGPKVYADSLARAATDILSSGWQINTRRNVTLSPDGDGYIALPAGIINGRIDTWGASAHIDITIDADNGRLYDVTNNTDVFSGDVQVEYDLAVSFASIKSDALQRYIVAETALRLGPKELGARFGPEFERAIRAERSTALGAARNQDIQQSDVSILDTADVTYDVRLGRA